MAHEVSPYLLIPPRRLAAACREIDRRWQWQSNPCGRCPIVDICAATGGWDAPRAVDKAGPPPQIKCASFLRPARKRGEGDTTA